MQSSSQTRTKQTQPVTPAEETYLRNWKDLHKNPWQAELPQKIFCDFPEKELKKVRYDSGQLLLFFPSIVPLALFKHFLLPDPNYNCSTMLLL